jgi:hypothetical protein
MEEFMIELVPLDGMVTPPYEVLSITLLVIRDPAASLLSALFLSVKFKSSVFAFEVFEWAPLA